MKHTSLACLLVLGLFIATSAHAGTADPGVNRRQAIQTARLVQGVHAGQVTRGEAHYLRDERRDIRVLEHAMKSDGYLSYGERAYLHHELNQSSRHIYRARHNRLEPY